MTKNIIQHLVELGVEDNPIYPMICTRHEINGKIVFALSRPSFVLAENASVESTAWENDDVPPSSILKSPIVEHVSFLISFALPISVVVRTNPTNELIAGIFAGILMERGIIR